MKHIIDNNSDLTFCSRDPFLVKNRGSHAFFLLTYIKRYSIYGQSLESSCCLIDSEFRDKLVMRERCRTTSSGCIRLSYTGLRNNLSCTTGSLTISVLFNGKSRMLKVMLAIKREKGYRHENLTKRKSTALHSPP